jgi:hypothetical protein
MWRSAQALEELAEVQKELKAEKKLLREIEWIPYKGRVYMQVLDTKPTQFQKHSGDWYIVK